MRGFGLVLPPQYYRLQRSKISRPVRDLFEVPGPGFLPGHVIAMPALLAHKHESDQADSAVMKLL